MTRKLAVLLIAAGIAAGPIVADDVYLANGEAFTGVIARHEGEHVLVRLEFGELKLPASTVARVVTSRSPLEEYLERRARLDEEGASAAAWMELAKWARTRELSHGYREALFRAAEIDPFIDSIRPEMRRLGHVFERELDRWIPYEEHMRRAGMVRFEGEWVRPESLVAEQAERERREQSEIEEVLSRTVEILAQAQLEREVRETEEARRSTQEIPYGIPLYGYPVAYGGVYVPPQAPREPREGPVPEPIRAPGYDGVISRPPGSLLPAGGANRGSFRSPPGSLIPSRGY